MNAKELMIGDFVYDVILQGYTKVEMLFPHGMKCDFHERVYDEKRFEPIPLTKEILEKNGWKEEFDKKKYMTKYHLEKDEKIWLMWCIEEKNLDIQRQNKELLERNWCATRICIPCDYVHTLQHALRLIGYEKEIIL